jgi:uncharacterized protein
MIIDSHNHCKHKLGRWTFVDDLVASMDRFGIDKCCCSAPATSGNPAPEEVKESNDDILTAVKAHPDRILGQCYLNPGYPREALEEMHRCIEGEGMVAVKLYHQYRINEPVQFPIIEKAIETGISILMHAAHPSDPVEAARQPRVSSGEHFADVAKRYPEAMIICAHIGGGGDWEWQIKALRNAPSIYLDTSGSVIDQGMIERCVRDLGADRLLFATDGSMARGIGKLADARITKKQKELIYSKNYQKILNKRKV